jgi:hypothetical protein
MYVIPDFVNYIGNHHTIGNHFFQFANAYAYSKKTGRKLILAKSNLSQKGDPLFQYYGWYEKILTFVEDIGAYKTLSQYHEQKFNYLEIPKIDADLVVLSGYYQSTKYFSDYKDEICSYLDPSDEIKLKCNKKWGWLYENPEKFVIIHARRTDYVDLADIHNPLPPLYYEKAMKEIQKYVKDPIFILVSDDSEYWKTIKFTHTVITLEESDPAVALYFLTRFKYYIIANSTFSWWGVFLSKKDGKKIITPTKWFGPAGPHEYSDIYEADWIRINQYDDIQRGLDRIDNFYYINLAHRADRNREFLGEMQKLMIPTDKIHRIEAICDPIFGIIGCVKSHIIALRTFIESGKEIGAFFEDDFFFEENVKTINEQIAIVFDKNIYFDVLFLGGNIFRASGTDVPCLKRIVDAQCASSYVVTKSYAPILLANFQESCLFHEDYIKTEGKISHDYCLDIYWKKLQAQHYWYIIFPKFGVQRESFSDILKINVNYLV